MAVTSPVPGADALYGQAAVPGIPPTGDSALSTAARGQAWRGLQDSLEAPGVGGRGAVMSSYCPQRCACWVGKSPASIYLLNHLFTLLRALLRVSHSRLYSRPYFALMWAPLPLGSSPLAPVSLWRSPLSALAGGHFVPSWHLLPRARDQPFLREPQLLPWRMVLGATFWGWRAPCHSGPLSRQSEPRVQTTRVYRRLSGFCTCLSVSLSGHRFMLAYLTLAQTRVHPRGQGQSLRHRDGASGRRGLQGGGGGHRAPAGSG